MNKKYLLLLLSLAVVALLPYLVAICYILPLADDFCNAWEAIRQPALLTGVSHLYCKMNGRFASNFFLLLIPIHVGLWAYRLSALGLTLLTTGAYYWMVKKIVSGKLAALVTALVVELFFLFQLPDLSEGVYWYSGYVIYQLSALVYISGLLLAWEVTSPVYIKTDSRLLKSILAPLLILITGGFNEPIALISCLTYFALFLYRRNEKENLALPILFAVLSVISLCILVFSPGSAVRASHYHFDRNIFKAIAMTQLQIIRFVADWLSNLPFVLLALIAIVRANKVSLSWLREIKWWWILLACYAVLMSCILLPYLFTGMLGQQRTVDLAYFLFIPLALFALVQFSRSRISFTVLSFFSSDKKVATIAAIAIGFMMLTKNGYKVGYDLASGTLARYSTEQQERSVLLAAHKDEAGYKLPPIQNRPLSITLYDEDKPGMEWVQKCQCIYLQKTDSPSTNVR